MELEVPYRINKSLLLDPILIQLNIISYSFKINFKYYLPVHI
jgi:hypothetical protein